MNENQLAPESRRICTLSPAGDPRIVVEGLLTIQELSVEPFVVFGELSTEAVMRGSL
jgi:hypothetical protein